MSTPISGSRSAVGPKIFRASHFGVIRKFASLNNADRETFQQHDRTVAQAKRAVTNATAKTRGHTMSGQLTHPALYGREPGRIRRISALLVLILLVCSATPGQARRLPVPPRSCAGLYVGTWTGNWGSTNVSADGTATPSNNLEQEWTCNGNEYTYYVPEYGRTFTGTLSADRIHMITPSPYTVATRVGGPPPSESKSTEKDRCSAPPPGVVSTTTAFDGVTACISTTNNNSLPRCKLSFTWRGSVTGIATGQVVNPGETAKQCGRPGETLSFIRWNLLPTSAR